MIFDSSVREAADDRLELEQQLQVAVQEKQFALVYEPGVDLRTGVVRGVETELRWDHPTRGRLGPAAFMTLAEDAGLAAELDRWVIAEACRQGGGLGARRDPARGRCQYLLASARASPPRR